MAIGFRMPVVLRQGEENGLLGGTLIFIRKHPCIEIKTRIPIQGTQRETHYANQTCLEQVLGLKNAPPQPA